MDRSARVASALTDVRADYALSLRSCANCRYEASGRCEHFAHWKIRHDPVSGATGLSLPTSTAAAREEGGLCGPEGPLFEPFEGWRIIALWLSRNAEWLPVGGTYSILAALLLFVLLAK